MICEVGGGSNSVEGKEGVDGGGGVVFNLNTCTVVINQSSNVGNRRILHSFLISASDVSQLLASSSPLTQSLQPHTNNHRRPIVER